MKFVSIRLALLLLAVFTINAQAELVGLWLFDEGSGTTATDRSGNGSDGIINNATWTDGKFGGGLEFNGTDANVEIPHSPNLSVEQFTLMAWMSVPGFTGTWQTIATQNTDGPTRNYGLFINNGSGLIHYSFTSGNGWQSFNATSNPVDGEWHHIAATYDKTNFICYIDGEVDAQTPNTLTPDIANTVVTIASWVGGGWLRGKLDEVALYNSALSQAEIQQVMVGLATPVESKGKLAISWGQLKRF